LRASSSGAAQQLLAAGRSRILVERAVVWTARGAAVAVCGLVAVEALTRWRALEGSPAALGACVSAGLATALIGWRRAFPNRREVALIADQALAGADRLATLVEFGNATGPLVARLRDEVDAWAARSDPRGIREGERPRFSVAVVVVGGAAALVLAVLPNPALEEARQRRADDSTYQTAIRSLDELAQRLAAEPDQPAAAQALQQQLRTAENRVRQARNRAEAAAALAQAQRDAQRLTPADLDDRTEAARAAGGALQEDSRTASAGAKLGSDRPSAAASDLRSLAKSLSDMDPDDRAGTSAALAAAAQAAAHDRQLSQSLKKAGDALGAGRTSEAARELEKAARALDALGREQASARQVKEAVAGLDAAKGSLDGSAAGPENARARPKGGSGSGTPLDRGSGGVSQDDLVYVPGVLSPGSGPSQAGEGMSQGRDVSAVPYDDVLGDYRSLAISQADRELTPETERDLVRRYFEAIDR
jgi:hypothetical protein